MLWTNWGALTPIMYGRSYHQIQMQMFISGSRQVKTDTSLRPTSPYRKDLEVGHSTPHAK
ncbi:uncharacterized protein PgNI_07301 [Pyricularia grisea]|uniref:Uncharacterized protein n=1 Tax=Pyricularia grisea TaxID=148305 RepID=A0A6P8B0J3_PYRGI|nr:uncharacterized protein PgNI_07301 [Pyricularia grisea]TLD08346.1 hypothetical protein PgNI_07301 [Pyricularia grisea]